MTLRTLIQKKAAHHFKECLLEHIPTDFYLFLETARGSQHLQTPFVLDNTSNYLTETQPRKSPTAETTPRNTVMQSSAKLRSLTSNIVIHTRPY